jgi:SAM-dependent methyltransferase
MIYNLLGVDAVQVKRLPPDVAASRNLDGSFGKDYFDGDRSRGYGGYKDDGRWATVAKKLQERYGLTSKSAVLDLGCAKGFLLKELALLIPGISVRGFEVSQYAKDTAPDMVKDSITVGYPTRLPYADETFHLVLAINSLHFMPEPDVRRTFDEMKRVVRKGGHIFVQVDAYQNELQHRSMMAWAPIIQTFLTPDEWDRLFANEKASVDTFYTIVELEDLR